MLCHEQSTQVWQPVEELPLRQSELGIASFVQAIVFAVIASCAILGVTMCMIASGGKEFDGDSGLAIGLGIALLSAVGIGISGCGLGIAALMQKGRRRLWAVLGLVFNAVGVLGILGLMALGMLLGN
jgi:hypothetical protein